MSVIFKELRQEIPREYHFLLHERLHDTSQIKSRHRIKENNGLEFNRCEKCNYDLLSSNAYKSTEKVKYRHPFNGYVHYYNKHKLVLCDKCVDELNGQPWR